MVSHSAHHHRSNLRQIRAADGVSLRLDHYATDASASASLCLAHGFGQTRAAWSQTATRLADAGCEVIAADARGHGDSGRNPSDQPYRFAQLLADVPLICAQASRPLPIWVGASMGGLLGLVAAAEAARSGTAIFSALVLVDIAPRWRDAGIARILDFMRAHPDGFASLDAAAEAVRSYLPHRPQKSAERLRALLRKDTEGRLRWHWDPRLLTELELDADDTTPMLEAAARDLNIPTLLISGGQSDLIGEEQVAHFLQLAPHARHIRLPSATHMVVGDDNDAFTEAILEFLPAINTPVADSNLPATRTLDAQPALLTGVSA